MSGRLGSKTRAQVRRVEGETSRDRVDQLATEEPLEIRLAAGGASRTLAITMRTPGADFELAAGFLHGEGTLTGRGDLRRIRYCTDPETIITRSNRSRATPRTIWPNSETKRR